jgi:hypothetical protein
VRCSNGSIERRPRIESPEDTLRLEWIYALQRPNKVAIIPVHVRALPPLKKTDLPDALQQLAALQSWSYDQQQKDHDLTRILDEVERAMTMHSVGADLPELSTQLSEAWRKVEEFRELVSIWQYKIPDNVMSTLPWHV